MFGHLGRMGGFKAWLERMCAADWLWLIWGIQYPEGGYPLVGCTLILWNSRFSCVRMENAYLHFIRGVGAVGFVTAAPET